MFQVWLTLVYGQFLHRHGSCLHGTILDSATRHQTAAERSVLYPLTCGTKEKGEFIRRKHRNELPSMYPVIDLTKGFRVNIRRPEPRVLIEKMNPTPGIVIAEAVI